MMRGLLLLSVLVLFGSCCYKAYCDVVMPIAQVRIVYHNYTPQEVQDATIYIADSNYVVLDSARNTYGDSVLYIFREMFAYQYAGFKDNIYIARIAGRSDTISAINYDEVHDQVKCGNCILGGNMQNITRYVNIRYNYKGTVQNTDSLVIYK